MQHSSRIESLEPIIVTADQMRAIEESIFAAGMPVAALMEKAAGLVAGRIRQLYPVGSGLKVGVLVGPGHNGGDALVVARELYLSGYDVIIYQPLPKLKELTQQHAQYVQSLGIPFVNDVGALNSCDLLIDGLFGFGLTREITGKIAEDIENINQWSQPVVSIDIPSGLHTDTGEVLGVALKASYSFCLGLWKWAFFQDQALSYLGKAERLDFGIPMADIKAILGESPSVQQLTPNLAKKYLPLPRPLVTHKYQQGHLLLICGSSRYAGGAILTALGARASGVGMLSIALPQSLKSLVVSKLPEALVIGCPETDTGAIAHLPPLLSDLSQFQAIACGPGLTIEATRVVETVLSASCPLLLDADALNIVAQLGLERLRSRVAPTVLTPHLGEFKRLFPEISNPGRDRLTSAIKAAQDSDSTILLKGARTAIANPQGSLWLIPDSTPALARGGSGDVLTGLIGGLMAQIRHTEQRLERIVALGAWWHAQAGILAAQERTELGVDAYTLSQYLYRCLGNISNN